MRPSLRRGLLTLGLGGLLWLPGSAPAEAAERLPTVKETLQGLETKEGLLTFHVDAAKGKIWLELPEGSRDGEIGRYIYVKGILTGLGSNPVGLDRGQESGGQIVVLRRLADRLLIEAPNYRFRALSEDPLERRAVRESFATSVIWAGPIAAEDADGRALVDFTPFVVRDAHGTARKLEATGQGSYSLDADRSVLDPANCLAFPDNVELEAVLTFSGSEPGPLVAATAPDPRSLTFVQHHSLIRLPDDGYQPRRADPRAGSFGVSFLDYAAPLDGAMDVEWIVRHRLKKVDPSAARSRVEEPIVYYVDPGMPQPVRGAIIDGASWWAEAFEAAGFIDAFRVEVLPADAHPLDIRYNVIQWVHRSTRGWSYGGGVSDPRTGERLKGHVWLGSLRVRQDRLLFEGLLGADGTGGGDADDPVQIALARLRQLSAHEVGHALGFNHNFAASTYDDRASVMDYPAPLALLDEQGRIDLSRAYGVGIGSWDKVAVRYAYSQFSPGADEAAELDAILQQAIAEGHRYITDQDARAMGSAHPHASLWDNGADAPAALDRSLAIRRAAMGRFGPQALPAGRPLAYLEEVLATVYLHHRFQIAATAKWVGGVDYRYALNGDGQPMAQVVSAVDQRRALKALLAALDPAALDLSDEILAALLPRPAGSPRNREMFEGATAQTFDPLAAAATAAGMVIDQLVEPARATRLVDQRRRNAQQLGLREVLDALITTAFADASGGRRGEIGRVVQSTLIQRLLGLASNVDAPTAVRARAEAALAAIAARETAGAGAQADHQRFWQRRIQAFLERPGQLGEPVGEPPAAPPGSPIGASDLGACSMAGS